MRVNTAKYTFKGTQEIKLMQNYFIKTQCCTLNVVKNLWRSVNTY